MKFKSVLSLLVAGLFMLATINVFADDDKIVTSVAMSNILQQLQTQGIVAVQKIELDDGVYKVKALNSQGQMLKLKVNPQTGALITPATPKNKLTMLQAVKLAEGAGYKNVYKVEADHGEYKMKAFDSKGSKAELEVDANSGKINKKWFD